MDKFLCEGKSSFLRINVIARPLVSPFLVLKGTGYKLKPQDQPDRFDVGGKEKTGGREGLKGTYRGAGTR